MHLKLPSKTSHEPWATYPVTRPYPFRWFTPIVFTSGLIAVTIFSTLNFAGNAYQMEASITTEPNVTLEQYKWLEQRPWSWAHQVRATCQPESIPLGTQLFTNQLGLTYTLTKVVSEDDESQLLPALPYLNNEIGTCDLAGITIYFPRSDGTNVDLRKDLLESANAVVSVDCKISTHKGPFIAQLVFSMTLRNADQDGLIIVSDKFVAHSKEVSYGAILAQAYWDLMMSQMTRSTPWNDTSGPKYDRSLMKLCLDPNGSFFNHSMFTFIYNWIQSDGVVLYSFDRNVLGPGPYQDPEQHNLGLLYNTGARLVRFKPHHDTTFPDIANESEGFTSSLFSLMMADLGQEHVSTITNNATILKRYLQGTDDHHNTTKDYLRNTRFAEQDNRTIWDLGNHINQSTLRNPGPSRISYQYVCSVPVRKGIFQIVVAIGVADFVMLSILWQIFDWLTARYIVSKDPHANYCEGCLFLSKASESLPLRVNDTVSHGLSRSNSPDTDPITQEENLAASYTWIEPGSLPDNEAQKEKQQSKPTVKGSILSYFRGQRV